MIYEIHTMISSFLYHILLKMFLKANKLPSKPSNRGLV
ncbi:hypothetical protein TB1_036381 [Malus domestica]